MTGQTVFQAGQLFVAPGVFRMTGYTEAHVHPVDLVNLVHAGDVAVTNGAIEPSFYMPLVIEVDISRHGIDLDPRDGLFLRPEFPYLGDLGLNVDSSSSVEVVIDVASRNMRMASHAFLNGGDAGVRGHIDKAMAILTRNLVLAGVYLVAEPYRLNGPFVAALCIFVEKIKSDENEYRQYSY
jgi:hypothetical protein